MLTMMSILLGELFDRSICGNDPLGQFLRPGMISERDYAQNFSIFGGLIVVMLVMLMMKVMVMMWMVMGKHCAVL